MNDIPAPVHRLVGRTVYECDEIMDKMALELKAILLPGEFIIRRGAFRWRNDAGEFLSNHYECQSIEHICAEHGYELVHDLTHIAVVKRIPPNPSDQRPASAGPDESRCSTASEIAK